MKLDADEKELLEWLTQASDHSLHSCSVSWVTGNNSTPVILPLSRTSTRTLTRPRSRSMPGKPDEPACIGGRKCFCKRAVAYCVDVSLTL